MFFNRKFPFYRQLEAMDCGPACLKMIVQYYGSDVPISLIKDRCGLSRDGVSILGLSSAAKSLGLDALAVRIPFQTLYDVHLPCILHWNKNHFVVLVGITAKKVKVVDPSVGELEYNLSDFIRCWATIGDPQGTGAVLLLEKTNEFRRDGSFGANTGIKSILKYIIPHRGLMLQLILGMVIVSLVQFILPFLTQSIIDVGIKGKQIRFIYIILFGQLFLFAGKTTAEFLRGWLLIHLSAKVNISIISDFLRKLFRLPISFFAAKAIGDLLRRIDDHSRIERFLSSSSLSALFSLVNLAIFGVVLCYYDVSVFIVFMALSTAYVIYILMFLRYRKKLDYRRFQHLAINQGNLVQVIEGIQDIKINGCEDQKMNEWKKTQIDIFQVNVKGTQIQQYQEAGALFINELKNMVITVMVAIAVIKGEMTLGMMLAVQYIIGQLNAPVNDIVAFIREFQDAKIGFERINEIHQVKNEESAEINEHEDIPNELQNIILNSISFRYNQPNGEDVVKELSARIPIGKTTAIVGTSGSGKTSVMKLLLKFYEPQSGAIFLDQVDFSNISPSSWRKRCGVVMQDGYLFTDTIARNIALSSERIDNTALQFAAKVANLEDFIESLPNGYNTTIGFNGLGLSQGQKQRVLIARAVYRKPEILFFDEATSSLDAVNEFQIVNNLKKYLKGKTIIVIAHRLSTVINSDQILVLDNGRLVESGRHHDLLINQNVYSNLVKNQMNLIPA